MIILNACSNKNDSIGKFVSVDINQNYPSKKISIDTFADIEYIQLALDDEYLFRGIPRIITDSIIIVYGFDTGDFLIFSREGKPIMKFNHRGNGPEDYSTVLKVIYDETAGELFVNTFDEIIVYSLSGEFKRRFNLLNESYINEIVDFDKDLLLIYDKYNDPAPFVLISKHDGLFRDTVPISRSHKIDTEIVMQNEKQISIIRGPTTNIVKYKHGYLLTDYSLDTVFYLSIENKKISPVLYRTPSIQKMEPKIYLNCFVDAGNYYFMCVVKVVNENGRLPRNYIMFEKSTNKVFTQIITMNEYTGKRLFLSPEMLSAVPNGKYGLIDLDITELKKALADNKLNGRLKTLVENSTAESNNIFMLLHFR
jgi:hypothetical protein